MSSFYFLRALSKALYTIVLPELFKARLALSDALLRQGERLSLPGIARLGAWMQPDTLAVSHSIPAENFPQGSAIRRLAPADKDVFLDHLLRLDAETRRSRFAMIASDEFLQRYAETTFALDTTIFAYEDQNGIRATGELRTLHHPDQQPNKAEAAFCVEAGWRERGIGTQLMELVLHEAEAAGITHMYINCLATNRKMQALARKFGASLSFEQGDVIGLLQPDASVPRPASTASRLWQDLAATPAAAKVS